MARSLWSSRRCTSSTTSDRVTLVETRTIGTGRGVGQLLRYQLANHLDSSVLELDQRAQVITYEEYYPYGSTSYQAVRAKTERPKRYRFCGRERLQETGLVDFGARLYIPWLGRWTAPEPLGITDGTNLYEFVGSNPIAHVEIDGRGWKDFARGAAKGFAVGLVVGALAATAPVSGTALLVIGGVGLLATAASAYKTHADFRSGKITAEQADEKYGELTGGALGGAVGGGGASGLKGALTALGESGGAPGLVPLPASGLVPSVSVTAAAAPALDAAVTGASAAAVPLAAMAIAGGGSPPPPQGGSGKPSGEDPAPASKDVSDPAAGPVAGAGAGAEGGAVGPPPQAPARPPAPIIGKPQVTGPGHAETSEEIAKQLSTDPYADALRVYLNKAVKTVTGNPSDPSNRPDVTLLSKDRSVTAIEVPSKTDTPGQLASRNLKAQLRLPPGLRGGLFIVHIQPKK